MLAETPGFWQKITGLGLAFPVIVISFIVGGLILSMIFGKRTHRRGGDGGAD